MTRENDLAAELRGHGGAADGMLDEVCNLIDSPPHPAGSEQHVSEEHRLDALATELGALIPAEQHAQLGALLDQARLSLHGG